jgi:hypothetical protein
MKKILNLSSILSWINLIAGFLFVFGGLMVTMVSPGIPAILLSIILPGAVILHSFATFQLRKSILDPALPLNHQAPVGIRLMGFMALFFSIMSFSNGLIILQQAPEAAKQIKLPPEAKGMNVVPFLRGVAVFILLISLGIALNLVLNFKLLKWYLIYSRKEQQKNGNES